MIANYATALFATNDLDLWTLKTFMTDLFENSGLKVQHPKQTFLFFQIHESKQSDEIKARQTSESTKFFLSICL
jgi:hypothetical protein